MPCSQFLSTVDRRFLDGSLPSGVFICSCYARICPLALASHGLPAQARNSYPSLMTSDLWSLSQKFLLCFGCPFPDCPETVSLTRNPLDCVLLPFFKSSALCTLQYSLSVLLINHCLPTRQSRL